MSKAFLEGVYGARENRINMLLTGQLADLTEEDLNGVEKINANFCYANTGLESVKLPEGLTEIGQNAFIGCGNLARINFPSTLTKVGGWAFNDCTSLSVFECPSTSFLCGVTFLSGSANPTYYAHKFYVNGSVVRDVVIPSTVTEVKDNAYVNAYYLTTITVGENVTSIGASAFSGCNGLTCLTVLATTPPTLANVNALNNSGSCPICVPAGSVNAYKTASNWSNYASRIQAIS